MGAIGTTQTVVPGARWDEQARVVDASGTSLQARIDSEFAKIVTPTRSEGWVCTVTIECGTIVCACE